jgi:hypothetical protein
LLLMSIIAATFVATIEEGYKVIKATPEAAGM